MRLLGLGRRKRGSLDKIISKQYNHIMNTTTLQIPINQQMRIRAARVAEKQGFSSLQELVRVFLRQLIMNKVHVSFSTSSVVLSDKNDERYAKMIADVKSGKSKTKKFSNIDKLMNYLNK